MKLDIDGNVTFLDTYSTIIFYDDVFLFAYKYNTFEPAVTCSYGYLYDLSTETCI